MKEQIYGNIESELTEILENLVVIKSKMKRFYTEGDFRNLQLRQDQAINGLLEQIPNLGVVFNVLWKECVPGLDKIITDIDEGEFK